MVNDFEINKIFIIKRRKRSFKNTSRPLSPKGDSEGIVLSYNYQSLNKMTGERVPVNDSTTQEHGRKSSRYSSPTNELPKSLKPANGESRKQLSQRIASNIDNLAGDDFEQRRSNEDRASDRSNLTSDKKFVTATQSKREKYQNSEKREDLVQMFSQIISKGPEARKHTSVDRQQESKTSKEKKRGNFTKKSFQYHKNAADNESGTDTGGISSKCYYTDVIDLRNQSNENGEHILQQISYYKPEPTLTMT